VVQLHLQANWLGFGCPLLSGICPLFNNLFPHYTVKALLAVTIPLYQAESCPVPSQANIFQEYAFLLSLIIFFPHFWSWQKLRGHSDIVGSFNLCFAQRLFAYTCKEKVKAPRSHHGNQR